MKLIFILCLLLLLGSIELSSVGYKLKKNIMSSSAQSCSNENYIVKSTLGQNLTGKVSCLSNKGMYGYWYFSENLIFIHDIGILKGWNLISTYLKPQEDRITSIFSEIQDDIVIVKNNMGKVYIPMYDIDDIVQWNFLEGYQVYSNKSVNLTVSGSKCKPESTPINMKSGWNMISYLRTSLHDIEDALKNLTDENALIIAKNNEGKVYMPEYDINDIGNMVPGQGYQIYLSKPATLLYPANSIGKIANLKIINSPKKLIPKMFNTGSNATLLLRIITEDGVEVGAFDSKDILVGSGIVQNNQIVITVWGNDLQIDQNFGIKTGEIFTLKALNPLTNTLSDLSIKNVKSVITNHSKQGFVYKNNEVYFAETEFSIEFNKLSVAPNPATSIINISFDINIPGTTKITLYNLNGDELDVISQKFFETGVYKIPYDISRYMQGVYYIKLENKARTTAKSLVIMR